MLLGGVLVRLLGVWVFFLFSSRRRHTRCALVTGVQTCALPICLVACAIDPQPIAAWLERGQVQLDRRQLRGGVDLGEIGAVALILVGEIGRASCRERVCQYV